jgi:hypothetical protein
MAAETGTHLELEIGHVLFMEVVGYSQLLNNEQREIQRQLTEIVRTTEHFRGRVGVRFSDFCNDF